MTILLFDRGGTPRLENLCLLLIDPVEYSEGGEWQFKLYSIFILSIGQQQFGLTYISSPDHDRRSQRSLNTWNIYLPFRYGMVGLDCFKFKAEKKNWEQIYPGNYFRIIYDHDFDQQMNE